MGVRGALDHRRNRVFYICTSYKTGFQHDSCFESSGYNINFSKKSVQSAEGNRKKVAEPDGLPVPLSQNLHSLLGPKIQI